ncbi:hypothetical protein MMC30_009424 [Trapelia coarctata]|nr:hypothetical protein [Trapelia coarctata]
MTSLFAIFVVFATLLAAIAVVEANCECGYSVSSTLYTELLETDFLHLPNITIDTDWAPQNYTVKPEAARGPYGKNASIRNVVSNPLQNKNAWTGDGLSGRDAGLQLWVRGGVPQNGLIPMAELASARADILYGSFRVAMKLTSIPGTCAAFFWYYNDTQEIDMEFLSQEFNGASNPVNLVLQSPASAEAGFNAANTSTFAVYPLPFAPEAEFHEYRFDWSPTEVSFFADGKLLRTMTDAVPSSPGHITLSHWSNGNTGWSAGPPATDAAVTVEYFKGYFNSSSPERQRDWALRCTDISAPNATCAVPEMTVPPDSNSSTYFFINQANSTVNQTVYNPSASQATMALQIWMFRILFVQLLLPFFF